MNKKIILITYILLVSLIIIMPMLRNNGIVHNIRISSDMDAHLGVAQGNNEHLLYGGQIVLKYVLKPFVNSDYLDTAYLWFNFVIVLLVAFLVTYIFRRLVPNGNYWVVVPIFLFSSTGILALIKYGVIFNVINMYLILIGAIFLIVEWLHDSNILKLLFASLLLVVFSLLHYTMIYLIPITILCVVVYLIWALSKHRTGNIKKALLICGISVGISIMALFVYMNMFSNGIITTSTSNIIGSISFSHVLSDVLLKTQVLINHISVPVLILLVIGCIYWGQKSSKEKTFLYIIGICAVALLGGYYLEINKDYNRLALDASTMIGIFTAFLIGSTLKYFKKRPLNIVIWTLILVGCIPNIIRWIV